MIAALKRHWPEYLMEAAELGAFMVAACLFGALLEHPASPVRAAIMDGGLRRGLMGLAMGATAAAIIYSPWGKQSGAHFNPAVTLTFYRLGKVEGWDATFYVAAQFAGGVFGVLLASLLLGDSLADPAVGFVATVPGPNGALAAFAAELVISFGLMSVVLLSMRRPAWAARTGLLCATLVALYITFEAPLSGMSMNPARTAASAAVSGRWEAAWIYFLAPPLGMLLAAAAVPEPPCAKLHHQNRRRCIFCGEAASPSSRAA